MKTDGETVLQTDVVVVGGGLAGMAAADAARAEGAQVLILDAPPWAWPPTRPFPTAFLQVPPPPIAPRPTFPTPYASAGLGLPWMARRIASDIGPGIAWLRHTGLVVEEKKDHYFVAAKGSRGCFLRKDYPLEDDQNWRQNSRIRAVGKNGDLNVTHAAAGADPT